MSVVHVIAAALRPNGDPEAVGHASRAALALAGAPGVSASHAGRSPTHLVAAVWLIDAVALEPFAASPAHMNFVMRGLAPVISGMWSVSATVERAAPRSVPAGLWAFALPGADGVFEWQVQRQLELIRESPGEAWVGPTVEERERYRAGGVVLLGAEEFERFEDGAAASDPDALPLDAALVSTINERATS